MKMIVAIKLFLSIIVVQDASVILCHGSSEYAISGEDPTYAQLERMLAKCRRPARKTVVNHPQPRAKPATKPANFKPMRRNGVFTSQDFRPRNLVSSPRTAPKVGRMSTAKAPSSSPTCVRAHNIMMPRNNIRPNSSNLDNIHEDSSPDPQESNRSDPLYRAFLEDLQLARKRNGVQHSAKRQELTQNDLDDPRTELSSLVRSNAQLRERLKNLELDGRLRQELAQNDVDDLHAQLRELNELLKDRQEPIQNGPDSLVPSTAQLQNDLDDLRQLLLLNDQQLDNAHLREQLEHLRAE